QQRRNPERERETLDLARSAFDAVLVHGDRRFIRLDASFSLASELGIPVHYTGFVAPSQPASPTRASWRGEIVVSGGGGAVGFRLMRAAIDARARSRERAARWRFLVGTNAADEELATLSRDANPNVVVERARPDFPELLAQASISVSQAGYNTVLDVMRSGARAVLVPFAENGETEQRMRADRLRERDLAVVVDEAAISGLSLAAAIDAAAAKKDWGVWDFDCDGAARSAAIIVEMMAHQHAGARKHGRVRCVDNVPPAHRGNTEARMSSWKSLDAELARWRSGGRCATFWCRDDDASRDSAALKRLLEIAESAALPIALATIPVVLERSLVAALAQTRFATVVQHGYAHQNHAPPMERKMELGSHRATEETIRELGRGSRILKGSFGERFVPVLVPPWNRIAAPIVAKLPDAGFRGLSTLGPRKTRWAAEGLLQCNSHVDLIDWRHSRAFIGSDAAIDCAVTHLRARREGAADADEPTGILTHHLDMQSAGWDFFAELVERTRDMGAAWIDVQAAFAEPGRETPISARSA
ncbi:MAG TPA: glycosyltransferase, partial [Casimicrobiaceae bacterium]|nr:glycosyltransferase [Casimicrobiaceae bacterium]